MNIRYILIFLIIFILNPGFESQKKDKKGEETTPYQEYLILLREYRKSCRTALKPFRYDGALTTHFSYKDYDYSKEVEIATIQNQTYRLSFNANGIIGEGIKIKIFDKPILIGAHFKGTGLLPSGENIKQLKSILNKYNIMGVIGACISPEIYAKVVSDLKSLEFPYGFKVNAFKNIPDSWNKAINSNPKEALGFRSDFTPEIFKLFVDNEIQNGASIVGGCCETYPEHISAISN